MKRVILFFFSFCLFVGNINGQFTIYLKNGDQVQARKVIFAGTSKQWNYKSQTRENKSVDYREVICVLKNRIIMFTDIDGNYYQGRIIKELKDFKPGSCADGALDAIKTLNFNGAGCGTGIVSFLVWPVGLVVAIVESSIPPNEENLKLNQAKLNDTAYCDCYRNEAKVVKRQKVWGGFGKGTYLAFMVAFIITELSML